MYAWIWRRLPGSFMTRIAAALALAILVLAALWYGAFPWAASNLPIDGSAFGG